MGSEYEITNKQDYVTKFNQRANDDFLVQTEDEMLDIDVLNSLVSKHKTIKCLARKY